MPRSIPLAMIASDGTMVAEYSAANHHGVIRPRTLACNRDRPAEWSVTEKHQVQLRVAPYFSAQPGGTCVVECSTSRCGACTW